MFDLFQVTTRVRWISKFETRIPSNNLENVCDIRFSDGYVETRGFDTVRTILIMHLIIAVWSVLYLSAKVAITGLLLPSCYMVYHWVNLMCFSYQKPILQVDEQKYSLQFTESCALFWIISSPILTLQTCMFVSKIWFLDTFCHFSWQLL